MDVKTSSVKCNQDLMEFVVFSSAVYKEACGNIFIAS